MIASLFGVVWFPLALLVAFILIQVQIFGLRPKIKPFWAKLQSDVANTLHQPHPEYAEMDDYYEKLENLTITAEERVRFTALLEQSENDPEVSDDFKARVKILRIAIPRVLDEAAGLIAPVDTRTIREKKAAHNEQ